MTVHVLLSRNGYIVDIYESREDAEEVNRTALRNNGRVQTMTVKPRGS